MIAATVTGSATAKIFLVGPLREDFSHRPLFCTAAQRLREKGFAVVNPVERMAQIDPDDYSLRVAVEACAAGILESDLVAVLPQTDFPREGGAEVALADTLGKPVVCVTAILEPVLGAA